MDAIQTSTSAFRPILLKGVFLCELQTYSTQILAQKTKVQLGDIPTSSSSFHPLVDLIAHLFEKLKEGALMSRQQISQQSKQEKCRSVDGLSLMLFENLGKIASAELYATNSKYTFELLKGILFEKHFIEIFKRAFFNGVKESCEIKLSYLDNILKGMCLSNYRAIFAENVFFMLGGYFQIIQKCNFEQSLYYIIWNTGKAFTSRNNFITRNLKNMKRGKHVNQILGRTVKLICSYQNKNYVEAEIARVAGFFFQQELFVQKEIFMERIKSLEPQSDSHVVWLFIDLIRAESMIMLDEEVKQKIDCQKEPDQCNFYVQQMQKLLKKCPYNGDDCCSCKKCQCVRRNRESAKLSQQKKRSAVEQLDPLKKRIEELEKRNRELEQENSILKGIFSELKGNQEFRRFFASTMEPISKVLND